MLFVLNSLAIGGSETKIIKVANALAKSGVPVKLAYLNPPETGLEQISREIPSIHLQRRGKYSISSLRKLRQLVDRETRVIVAVSLYPLLYVVPAAKWERSKSVRAVALVNTSEAVGKVAWLARGYAVLLRQCDGVVFGSSAQRADWVQRYKLPLQRSQVIYNGVDHEFYSPDCVPDEKELFRRELKLPLDVLVIGSIGRLAPEKNYDLLISALARLRATGRNAYLVLVGTGKEEARLQRQAREEGVGDRVRFAGLLKDVRPALSLMDVFVLPSSAVETFSNAALEAMAMSRAVVLSEIGGAAEMVEHGKSGMLFPVGSIRALTDVLYELHDNGQRREVLGAAARNRVIMLFGFRAMLAQYKALLPK